MCDLVTYWAWPNPSKVSNWIRNRTLTICIPQSNECNLMSASNKPQSNHHKNGTMTQTHKDTCHPITSKMRLRNVWSSHTPPCLHSNLPLSRSLLALDIFLFNVAFITVFPESKKEMIFVQKIAQKSTSIGGFAH